MRGRLPIKQTVTSNWHTMNPSYSTLLDARIANVSRVTELWENTYLDMETIAVQTGLSLRLVTTIIEETGVKRLRSEPLGASNTSFGIEKSQVRAIMHLFNTTTISIKAISKQPGIFYHPYQVQKVIASNTTKEEREDRRKRGVKERGGLDVFKQTNKAGHTTWGREVEKKYLRT